MLTFQTEIMKAIFLFARTPFVLLLFTVLLAACSVKPTFVARKYFTALEQQDYETARQYVSPGSITNFNKLFDYGKKPAKSYTILRYDQTDDHHAKVYYTEDGDTTEHYVDLVKVDDEWKIEIPDSDDYDK